MSQFRHVHVKSFQAEFIASGATATVAATDGQNAVFFAPNKLVLTDRTSQLRVTVELFENSPRNQIQLALANEVLHLLVGDYTEANTSSAGDPFTNAVPVEINLREGSVRATCSIVGLPPVFVARRQNSLLVTCPFMPLDRTASAAIDLEAVADILRWGHPIDGRTLFNDTKIAPAECVITLTSDGALRLTDPPPLAIEPLLKSLTQREIVDRQIAALDRVASRMPAQGSFVSLSGGLDSRTALVAMLNHGHAVSCVTLAASDASLDARLARQFCAAHGLQHHTVNLDDSYLNNLPQLALEAAALTGGTACLSQTIDLHLYNQLQDGHQSRVSGNLGNQVGRGGLESLSAAQPDTIALSGDVRAALARRKIEPWFIDRMAGGKFGEVLFRQEIPYWSVANYCIGSSRALQLTPYADRQLIALSLALYAQDPELQNPSRDMMRRRDIRHRLAGVPANRSFQRRYLIERDALGRKVPLNWGWIAAGGWSSTGCLSAATGAADAGLLKLAGKSKRLAPVFRWMSAKLGRPSALVGWPSVLKTQLRDLTYDVLLSQEVQTSGVFDPPSLTRLLDRHYSSVEDNHSTIYRLLEIGLGIHARNAGITTRKSEQPAPLAQPD